MMYIEINDYSHIKDVQKSTNEENLLNLLYFNTIVNFIRIIMNVLIFIYINIFNYNIFITVYKIDKIKGITLLCLSFSSLCLLLIKELYTNIIIINITAVLYVIFLIIPSVIFQQYWIPFLISNSVILSSEYAYISIISVLIMIIKYNCSNRLIITVIESVPSVIGLISLIEYEIRLIYMKNIRITKFKVSITCFFSFIFMIIGIILFYIDVIHDILKNQVITV
ncbi:hypothetical protein NEPAR07_2047 [Nematocida parisii]|uniref:Uncharacterized protein n=1 Tax=Nematocida parisii (strain ERTm3) TaxID=935791 RepID=I3EFX5_NEMP3|nr:hypothetical protein NEQG_01566 [Nematocida parisii ERTm3]KAI5146026.1 hypothetical protein NEPAR07_2047 [Nematocida parisii]